MTEGDWLACTDVSALLAEPFIGTSHQKRRLRLFSIACCRQLSQWVNNERLWKCLDASERYADGKLKDAGLDHWTAEANKSWQSVEQSTTRIRHKAAVKKAHHAIAFTCLTDRYQEFRSAARIILSADKAFGKPFIEEMRSLFPRLLRDIFGNPFRPIAVTPSWRTATVQALAQAACEHRDLPVGTLDPDRLGVLADALEDAGCTDAGLLIHLRSSGPHVHGCHVLDLILCRE